MLCILRHRRNCPLEPLLLRHCQFTYSESLMWGVNQLCTDNSWYCCIHNSLLYLFPFIHFNLSLNTTWITFKINIELKAWSFNEAMEGTMIHLGFILVCIARIILLFSDKCGLCVITGMILFKCKEKSWKLQTRFGQL